MGIKAQWTTETIGTRVIFAREQVRRSRMHAGIQGEVKTLMPGLCSWGYSTLTTWSVDRLHLNHHQSAFEMLASEANGGLFHHQTTRPGLVLEATCVNDLGYNYLGNCINAECSLLVRASSPALSLEYLVGILLWDLSRLEQSLSKTLFRSLSDRKTCVVFLWASTKLHFQPFAAC